MFGKKNRKEVPVKYDRENFKPIIRASICNGEQVAGFRDVRTGKFSEVMLIRDRQDLDAFVKEYDLNAEEIKKEY